MCNYMRFGGCRVDLPAGWLDQAQQVVAGFPRFLDEFEALLVGNEILMARTQGVGVLSAELAVNAGISGPMRAPAASTTTSARSTTTASTTASPSASRSASTATSTTAT